MVPHNPPVAYHWLCFAKCSRFIDLSFFYLDLTPGKILQSARQIVSANLTPTRDRSLAGTVIALHPLTSPPELAGY